jgi:uncharacterized phage protein (TIGR01671 family)
MREIKFRAWDVDRKAWMNEQDVYNEVQEQGRWNPERGERFRLMQFTGLLDKNGKEIYEGDIVRLHGWWDANGPSGYEQPEVLVFWSEKHCGFDPYANYDCDCGVHHEGEESEIIGNIYENPELIEEGQS